MSIQIEEKKRRKQHCPKEAQKDSTAQQKEEATQHQEREREAEVLM